MDNSLEAKIGQLLTQRRKTLAAAESCTGGLIAHRITGVAGSSAYFMGGAVTYSNEAKQKILGVQAATLAAQGAVSAETALEMARGARRLFGVDIAVSATGIAGPGGATPGKPVGLTFIGLSADGYERVERYVWEEDRAGNKAASAEAALQMILSYLESDWQKEEKQMTEEYATSVEAEIAADGTVRPRTFTWQGERKVATSVGRQWVEGERRHVLVMTAGNETYELIGAVGWVVKKVGERATHV